MTESVTPNTPPCRGLCADVALILLVIALGAKASYGVAPTRDLDAADEGAYLHWAAHVPAHGLPPVEGSPAYVLWDSLIVRCGVPVQDVPATSWAILASLLPSSVYVLTRAIGGGKLVAFAVSGILPATTLIDVYPYPMHLATVILALGTALAAGFRRAGPAAATLGVTLLLATYARPEFLYSLFLFVPLAALGGTWLLWRRRESRKSVLLSVAVFVGGAGVLIWVFGSPKGDGSRSVVAFGQHYAMNRYVAGERWGNPWHLWEEYVRADFGTVAPLGELWRANRDAVLWHVGYNGKQLSRQLKHVITPWVDLSCLNQWHLFPPEIPCAYPRTLWVARAGLLAVFATGLIGLCLGAWRRWRGGGESATLPVAPMMLGLVAAPALAASLLIYPRFHYLIPTLVFAIALSASGYRHFRLPDRLRGRLIWWLALLGTAVGLAAVVPNRAAGLCLQSGLDGMENGNAIVRKPMPLRASVAALRGLGLDPSVVCFDHSAVRVFYAGFRVQAVRPMDVGPGESFRKFVERTQVGVVVLDTREWEFPQFRHDPDFCALVASRETDQFRLIRAESLPEVRFAVRRDVRTTGEVGDGAAVR